MTWRARTTSILRHLAGRLDPTPAHARRDALERVARAAFAINPPRAVDHRRKEIFTGFANASEIGARIEQIRGSLSQEAFANSLGVSRKTIWRYEAGKLLPASEFIIKLYVVYKVQPLWILTGQGSRQ